MSKAEEATNDFCTRCFKYGKCHKVQSECTTADSYQEGYEDGYQQAEKDLKLSWEDMMIIHRCIKDAINYHLYKMMEGVEGQKVVYQEVLKRFNKIRNERLV